MVGVWGTAGSPAETRVDRGDNKFCDNCDKEGEAR
jgi:hypothetical protein